MRCAACNLPIHGSAWNCAYLFHRKDVKGVQGRWEPCCDLACADHAVVGFSLLPRAEEAGVKPPPRTVVCASAVLTHEQAFRGVTDLYEAHNLRDQTGFTHWSLRIALGSFLLSGYTDGSVYDIFTPMPITPVVAQLPVSFALAKLNASCASRVSVSLVNVLVRFPHRKLPTTPPFARKSACSEWEDQRALQSAHEVEEMGRALAGEAPPRGTLLPYAAWGDAAAGEGVLLSTTGRGTWIRSGEKAQPPEPQSKCQGQRSHHRRGSKPDSPPWPPASASS